MRRSLFRVKETFCKLQRFSLLTAVGLTILSACGLDTQARAQQPERVRVLIGFHQPPGQAELNAVQQGGGKVTSRFRLINSVAAEIPANAVAGLAKNPLVKIVEPDMEVMADEYGNDWGIARIGSRLVHEGNVAPEIGPLAGAGVRVAVIDTGIDYNHPDLAAVYAGGYDFVNNDPDPYDDQYHGTHCAGTIAASLNGFGVVGVAPEASLYGLKVLSSTGSGSYSYVISALDWCVANQIQVASLSLGSSGDPGSQVRDAFNRAYNAGIVVVSSAGNSGAGTDTVGYPAKYDSVIAVGSTTQSDSRSSFSSTGPAVEVAAPGSSILSTYPGNSYAYLSGTSMACPHVSGVAALLLSGGVADANGNGQVNDDVRLALQVTAEDLGPTGRDNDFGFGLVDAAAAVALTAGGDGGGGGGDGGGGDPVDPNPVFNAPTNLAGTASLLSVTLFWDDNSNAEEAFQIQYGTKSRGTIAWSPDFVIAPASDTVTASHTFDLPASGTYRLRVRAIAEGGTQATNWSNSIQLSVSDGSGGGGGGGGGGKGRKK
jgi:subtilisin family serine protease